MSQPQNSDEDTCGQIFISWIKDTHETATRENFLRLQDVLNKRCDDKNFVLRSQRLGVNAAITIARLLDRSPVEKIDLYDNVVRDHGVQALAQIVKDSRALTHLNVGSNDIGPLGAIYLASSLPSSNKLQCLILGSEDNDMHMNKVDCEAAKAIAESAGKCKNLRWLDLNNNPVGRESQEAFIFFAKLLERNIVLETLKLGVTDMHTSSAIALVKALTNNTNLSFLDLHGNDLQPAVGESIAELIESKRARGKPSCLKSLLLNGNPRMLARGIVPICRVLKKDTALHTLDLTGTSIGDEGAFALADALQENQSLTHLDLSDNDISEDGCVALCTSLQNNTGVAYLALSHNKLKDEGAVALAHTLEVNSTLEHIQLTSTRLSDRGAVALGVALSQNTTVHCLKIGHNHISDQAGRALAELLDKNWRLLTIDIRGNQVSHATLLRLKRVVKKNKALRDGQTPNQLQHEVIRLHYQQYKLSEANQELKDHQKARMDLQEEADKTERKAMQEKENTAKRSKEIIEKIYMVENFCEDLRAKRKAKDEEDQKNHVSHDQEMKALQEKLKVDTQQRIERQADWEAIDQQYKRLEQERQDKLKALKERIQEARVDRDNWNQKRKEYRQQAQRSQEIIADLEKQLAEVQARRVEAERLKRDEVRMKKKANKARSKALDSALIDNLLNAT